VDAEPWSGRRQCSLSAFHAFDQVKQKLKIQAVPTQKYGGVYLNEPQTNFLYTSILQSHTVHCTKVLEVLDKFMSSAVLKKLNILSVQKELCLCGYFLLNSESDPAQRCFIQKAGNLRP
jgi:hypothetical protein